MARGAPVVSQRPALKQWTSGWQCCGKRWRRTTTGWMTFSPASNHRRLQKRRKTMSKLTLKTEGNTHVVVTRRFAAPPETVYRAHTDPKLIQKWRLGPEGWTMPVCINEARSGGKIRYEWTDGKGAGFSLTGEYLELVPFSRIAHVERMHLPDPTPDNHVETTFDP